MASISLYQASGGGALSTAFCLPETESLIAYAFWIEQGHRPHYLLFGILQICKGESAQSSKCLQERSISIPIHTTHVYVNGVFPLHYTSDCIVRICC